jgi:hypothetical protein
MPILASYKPEMQAGNKMAAAAFFIIHQKGYSSVIYQTTTTKIET